VCEETLAGQPQCKKLPVTMKMWMQFNVTSRLHRDLGNGLMEDVTMHFGSEHASSLESPQSHEILGRKQAYE